MKNLILTAVLALSFSSFAAQTHDVNCESLVDSNDRVNVDSSSSQTKQAPANSKIVSPK